MNLSLQAYFRHIIRGGAGNDSLPLVKVGKQQEIAMKTLISDNINTALKRCKTAIITTALLVTFSVSTSTLADSTVQLVTGCKGTAFMRLQTLVEAIAGTTSSTSSSTAGRTVICHVTPQTLDVTIEVSDSSLVPAHYAHGDLEGACGTADSAILVTEDIEGSDELADCLLPTDTAGILSAKGGGGNMVNTGRQSWLERR